MTSGVMLQIVETDFARICVKSTSIKNDRLTREFATNSFIFKSKVNVHTNGVLFAGF